MIQKNKKNQLIWILRLRKSKYNHLILCFQIQINSQQKLNKITIFFLVSQFQNKKSAQIKQNQIPMFSEIRTKLNKFKHQIYLIKLLLDKIHLIRKIKEVQIYFSKIYHKIQTIVKVFKIKLQLKVKFIIFR